LAYKGFVTLLIDEVDNILPNPDVFFTFLAKTLPRRIPCRLILILLTNRLDWEKALDPRILSFLKKNDIIFEPYDAVELLEILKLRSDKALKKNRIDEAALKKVAAYASRETGDARKAVELLAKAVEIAENGSGHLTEKEVDTAEELLEVDKSMELIRALATQQRIALQGCYSLFRNGKKIISTGEAYEVYNRYCNQNGFRSIAQRRFCDVISFLDLYGLIDARVVSRGRYGKTREIRSSLPDQVIDALLGISNK
jgi:cell division control protein 6